MTWNDRVGRSTPIIFSIVNIGMAHTAKFNINVHILRSDPPAHYMMWNEWCIGGMSCVTRNVHVQRVPIRV